MIGDVLPDGWTIRTIDGKSRATYEPTFSPSLPWAIFINGTATRRLTSLAACRQYFAGIGRPLETEEDRKARLGLAGPEE